MLKIGREEKEDKEEVENAANRICVEHLEEEEEGVTKISQVNKGLIVTKDSIKGSTINLRTKNNI